jgi:hypothetical protein
MKNKKEKTKDPVKYRALINQFRKEWVIPTEDLPVQILDTSQNFSLWLTKNGYKIIKTN